MLKLYWMKCVIFLYLNTFSHFYLHLDILLKTKNGLQYVKVSHLLVDSFKNVNTVAIKTLFCLSEHHNLPNLNQWL